MVEKVWTTHFVLEHSQDEKVNFGILNEETLYSDALSISRNEIDVYGTTYNPSNTKVYLHLMETWSLNILIIQRNFSALLKKGILIVSHYPHWAIVKHF